MQLTGRARPRLVHSPPVGARGAAALAGPAARGACAGADARLGEARGRAVTLVALALIGYFAYKAWLRSQRCGRCDEEHDEWNY